MENVLIDIIYELLENNNNEKLKDIEIKKYTNLLYEKVIEFVIDNERYLLTCFEIYEEREVN